MHYNYAFVPYFVMVLIANSSHSYTMLIDVEEKQVQIECQVELYSIAMYNIILQHSIIDYPFEFLVA